MSSLLFAELAATCNALGYSDNQKYFTDLQCEEAVKDLIRYLRRDDENHEIRRHLGEAKILQTDLIPILKEHYKRSELFDHVLRLLVNLTYPALVLYNAELPEDKTARYYYLQIISHLQSYKEAFVDEVVWAVLCRKLGQHLNTEWQDRSEDEGKMIERILTLMRNVLQVPADSDAEKRPDNDATIHDQVLWALYQSGVVGLLHYIISSKHEDKYHMHVLEIISQMLRDQNPEFLAQAEAQRSVVEKTRDEAELLAIRQREAEERHQKVEKYTGLSETCGEKPRIKNYWGSRFAGTYVVKDVKSISNNDMIYHKPLATLSALDLNHDKQLLKKPKNKRPPTDAIVERRSTLSVRLFLKEFCIEFLNGAYNTLMYSVKEMIHHGKNQVNDESYYLWAMKFFMEFNRHYKAEMKLISETMSLSSFHFIQTQIESYQESMLVDKKKIFVWGRRMHLALRAYQELLMTLGAMDRSNDPDVRESARIIKSNIFYVVEYRELILFLMVNFDQAKFSRAFLKDLIETVHTFLRLLEQFSTRSRGIIVQDKQKSRKQKRKKATNNSNPSKPTPIEPEALWDELTPGIRSVIENQLHVPEDVVPFDSASDVPIDEQKVDAVKRIQTGLRERKLEIAVGLLRASREVWPENDSFGAPNPAPEEEILALKEIFLADLGQPMPVPESTAAIDQDEEEEEEDEEEEGGGHNVEMTTNVSEKTFQFLDFVKRFCNPRAVQACGILLRQFNQNSVRVNHCILKLLHRMAWDCKLPSIVFQASLFRTFQRILESGNSEHKELKKFAAFIIRKFVEVAKTNPKVYMELLFWKTSKDAYEIECGYGNYQSDSHASKQVWGEEEEDELHRLYEEYMNLSEKPVEEDMADWILRNLISDSRSRRGVIKKLKELGYVVITKPSRKSVSTKPPVEWSVEEEEQLTALFHKFKSAYDPVGCILNHLTVRRPKARVVEKLLALNLVQDKKELRKKRGKKDNSMKEHSEDSGEGTDIDESEEDRDSESDEESRSAAPIQASHQHTVRKMAKAEHRRSSRYSQDEASRLIRQVRAAGMTEALDWLAESLEDIAEDADDNSDESTPLLPLTEACMIAMDSLLFQQFLQSLGIRPPTDEQESYWRVPGNLTAEELRTRKSVIDEPTSEEYFNSEDLDKQVAEECRKMVSENEKELENELIIGSNESEILETSTLSSLIQTPKSTVDKKSVSESSFPKDNIYQPVDPNLSDDSKEIESSGRKRNRKEKEVKKRKMKFFLNSSSESEDESQEQEQLPVDENEGGTSKRILDSDSDTECRKAKNVLKPVLNISSDSEDETQEHRELFDAENKGQITKRILDSDSERESPKAKKHCKVFLSDDEC